MDNTTMLDHSGYVGSVFDISGYVVSLGGDRPLEERFDEVVEYGDGEELVPFGRSPHQLDEVSLPSSLGRTDWSSVLCFNFSRGETEERLESGRTVVGLYVTLPRWSTTPLSRPTQIRRSPGTGSISVRIGSHYMRTDGEVSITAPTSAAALLSEADGLDGVSVAYFLEGVPVEYVRRSLDDDRPPYFVVNLDASREEAREALTYDRGRSVYGSLWLPWEGGPSRSLVLRSSDPRSPYGITISIGGLPVGDRPGLVRSLSSSDIDAEVVEFDPLAVCLLTLGGMAPEFSRNGAGESYPLVVHYQPLDGRGAIRRLAEAAYARSAPSDPGREDLVGEIRRLVRADVLEALRSESVAASTLVRPLPATVDLDPLLADLLRMRRTAILDGDSDLVPVTVPIEFDLNSFWSGSWLSVVVLVRVVYDPESDDWTTVDDGGYTAYARVDGAVYYRQAYDRLSDLLETVAAALIDWAVSLREGREEEDR